MSKSSSAPDALLQDVVSATVATTGYPEAHVRQFVEPALRYLLREYGGDRLPKPRRTYPVDDIRRAVDQGETNRDVCRRFRISMWTLHRILGTA